MESPPPLISGQFCINWSTFGMGRTRHFPLTGTLQCLDLQRLFESVKSWDLQLQGVQKKMEEENKLLDIA